MSKDNCKHTRKMDPSVYIDQDNKNIQTGAERSVPNQFPETLPQTVEITDKDPDEDDNEYDYQKSEYYESWNGRNMRIHNMWLQTISQEKHQDEHEAIQTEDIQILQEEIFDNLTDTPQLEFGFQDLHITQKIIRYEINFKFQLYDDSSINEKANILMIGTEKSQKIKLYLLKFPPQDQKSPAKYKLCLEYRVKDNKQTEQNEDQKQKKEVSYSHKIISNHEVSLGYRGEPSENQISICYQKDEKNNCEIILKWRLKVKEPHQEQFKWKDKDQTMASHKNEILIPEKTDIIFVGSDLPQDYFKGRVWQMRLWCEVNSNEVPERQAKRLQYTDIEKNMYMETSKAFVPPDLNRSLSQSRPFSAVSAKSQRLNKTGMSFVMSDTVPYSDSQSFFTTSGGIGGGRSSVYRSNINNNNNTVVNGSELENPEMAQICQAIADNYVWITTLSNILSPTVDQAAVEEGQFSHSFPCLASQLRRLCQEPSVYISQSQTLGLQIYNEEHPEVSQAWPLSRYMEKNMPMNVIELDRFLKVLHFSQIPINRDELIAIAQSQDLYQKYTKLQFQKIDHKTIAREEDRELQKDVEWSYEAVFYEKFLKYCRNNYLDSTERDQIIEQCYLTVKNFDEDRLNLLVKAKEQAKNNKEGQTSSSVGGSGGATGAGGSANEDSPTKKGSSSSAGGATTEQFVIQAFQDKQQGDDPTVYSVNTLNELRKVLKEEGRPCTQRDLKKWRVVGIDFVKYAFSNDLIEQQIQLVAAMQRENVVNVLEFFDSLKIVRNVGLSLGAFERLLREWEFQFPEDVMKALFQIISGGQMFISAQRLHDFIHGFYLHVIYAKLDEGQRTEEEQKKRENSKAENSDLKQDESGAKELFEYQTISIFDQNKEEAIPLYSNPCYLQNSQYIFDEIVLSRPKDCEYFEPYFLGPKVVQKLDNQDSEQQDIYEHMDNWYDMECLDSSNFISNRRSHDTKVIHGFNVKFRFVNVERLSLIKKLQYTDFEPIFTRRFTPFISRNSNQEAEGEEAQEADRELREDFLDIAESFTEEELQYARKGQPYTVSLEVFREILMENFTRRYRKLQKLQLYEQIDIMWENRSNYTNEEYNFWLFFQPTPPPQEEEFPAYQNTPDLLPCPDPIWNQGKFEIVVHHCMYCERHQQAFTHQELDFLQKFMRLGDAIKQVFPNIHVKLFKPPEPQGHPGQVQGFEHFDVYIYGVGEQSFRDQHQRITLFKKTDSMRNFRLSGMFKMVTVLDWLVLLSLSYGTSTDLEEEQVLNQQEMMLEQTDGENYLEHPLSNLPRRAVLRNEDYQQEEKEELQKYGMFCQNWGCYQEFQHSPDSTNIQMKDSFFIQFQAREFEKNPNPSQYSHMCRYHPGEFQPQNAFGGEKEYWSCCFGPWDSQGCFMGPHRGTPLRRTKFLCVNHGQINPSTGIPDSACGKSFLKSQDNLACSFHKGYFSTEPGENYNKWTCCGDEIPNSRTCSANEGVEHKQAAWPDEAAQVVWVIIKYKYKMVTSSTTKESSKHDDARWKVSKSIVYLPEADPSRQFKPGFLSIPKNEDDYFARELPYQNGQEIYCKHYGCNRMFAFSENVLVNYKAAHQNGGFFIQFNQNEFQGDVQKTPTQYKYWCRYHPGKLSIPSRFGADRQFWTCCSEPWETQGCFVGCHQFVSTDKLFFNCVNHGELNPQTYRPDSACGQAYKFDQLNTVCNFHKGYFDYDIKKWTCCGKRTFDADPCSSETEKQVCHRTAVWPNEEAKIHWIVSSDFQVNLSQQWVQQGFLADNLEEDDLQQIGKFSLSSIPYRKFEN